MAGSCNKKSTQAPSTGTLLKYPWSCTRKQLHLGTDDRYPERLAPVDDPALRIDDGGDTRVRTAQFGAEYIFMGASATPSICSGPCRSERHNTTTRPSDRQSPCRASHAFLVRHSHAHQRTCRMIPRPTRSTRWRSDSGYSRFPGAPHTNQISLPGPPPDTSTRSGR